METIIDTFYNRVIPGLLTGKIVCGIYIRAIANVSFVENNKLVEAHSEINGLEIPTFQINNKVLLESLLTKYVNIMKDFNFPHKDSIDKEDLNTYIIACAIANMAPEDYLNPEGYFNKLCYIHENNPINNHSKDLGYNDTLKGELFYSIQNDFPNQECPFAFKLLLKTDLGLYEFPIIRFYIIDNTAFIGAIQNTKSSKDKTLNKKVRRKLYKVNEGLNQDNPLMEVDPSVVCSLSVFTKLLSNYNINNIKLLPYSLQRSNDKKIQIHYLNKMLENPQTDRRNKIVEVIHKSTLYFERLPQIRSQLETSIQRLHYHFPNTIIFNDKYEPFISIYNLENCNNQLLTELSMAVNNKKTR